MAASIKISELNSLTNLTDVDLFLVSDMETGTSKKVSYSSLKSNVTADVSSALTSLTNVVSQNRTDAETLVESVRAALQAAVDANTAGYTSADTAIDTRLDVLEADPTTQSDLDALSAQVTTLSNAITAVQTEVNALDVDIAPETLNSIDELAQALGDDPTFLTTLQNRLSAIENDNATQTELDAVNQSIQASFAAMADDIDQNEADADAAIAAETAARTAADANLQSQIDALDVDLAPETLNSINELAAAMGDDPTFLTTLQGRVTTIENDNATQTELDAYKAFVDDMNFQLMLAYDTPTYIDTLFGG